MHSIAKLFLLSLLYQPHHHIIHLLGGSPLVFCMDAFLKYHSLPQSFWYRKGYAEYSQTLFFSFSLFLFWKVGHILWLYFFSFFSIILFRTFSFTLLFFSFFIFVTFQCSPHVTKVLVANRFRHSRTTTTIRTTRTKKKKKNTSVSFANKSEKQQQQPTPEP